MELLDIYDVSIFNLSEEDLENDILNATEYILKHPAYAKILTERIAVYDAREKK